MRAKLLLVVFCLILSSLASHATHIVGGEFELVHLNNFNYRLSLIQYFDDINGNPLIKQQDLSVLVYIYRKRDDMLVRTITLPRISITDVSYTNINCTIGSLKTSKLIYASNITLSADHYGDPEGYYIVWERCCRNGTITNITNPGTTGQTFYLEFPPVVKDDSPFINSSPVLFPPLSDYACVNQPYYVDFNGTDPDGDSVVYKLVTPLNTSDLQGGPNGTPNALPTPSPAPHAPITWVSGIGLNNIIPGSPTLQINKAGLLTVTPNRRGLYVFSVLAEEYRDRKKIGEVRRDFQMLVIDCPPPGVAPQVQVKLPNSNVFYSESETITFGKDDPKCIKMLVTDKDGRENIRLKAIPVNFSADLGGLFTVSQGFIENASDTLEFEVCFPQCPFIANKPYIVDLIAMDNTCSLPLADTIRVTVFVEPPVNESPRFTSPNIRTLSASLMVGETFNLPINARDGDNDFMTLEVLSWGFTLEDYGMKLTKLIDQEGQLDHSFKFTADCNKYDFSTRQSFPFTFIVKDLDDCNFGNPDTLLLNLNLIFPSNNIPVVSIPSLQNLEITARIGTTLVFDVLSKDADNDMINLKGFGKDFDLVLSGAEFPATSGTGATQSTFTWPLICEKFNLTVKDEYEFLFVSEDLGSCKGINKDTLRLKVKILPPLNDKPVVSINDLANTSITLLTGSTLDLEVIGYDQDNDFITLELVEVNEKAVKLSYHFEPVNGIGLVRSRLQWTPECSILDKNSVDNRFEFTFVVKDNKCVNRKADTLKLEVMIEDIPADYEAAQFYNFFSPNGDALNPTFIVKDLPEDNCFSQFIGVFVYDRYGKLVFQSPERDFQWDGRGAANGVYYYHVRYTQHDFKGWVHLVY